MRTALHVLAGCLWPRLCRPRSLTLALTLAPVSGGISRARELLTQAVQFLECSDSRRKPPESAMVPTARLGTQPLMPQFESRGRLHQFGQGS